jgi:alpha-ketoglutarate-dependent taurine dioxygenase
MSKTWAQTFSSATAAGTRATRIKLGNEDLTTTSWLDGRRFPLVVMPAIDGVSLPAWATQSRDWIEGKLLAHGAILFRGFSVDSVETFRTFAAAVSDELIDYRERAAPRIQIAERVFTSSAYPANQIIHLHHEMSYAHNWPAKVFFYCRVPAPEGGSTPIARERDVFPTLDPGVRDQFRTKGVMYVRNFGPELDLSWQEAFQTDDPQCVENYCRQSNIKFEWKGSDRLRTMQVRQGVERHPITQEQVFFNHAAIFHLSSLPAAARQSLSDTLALEDLPRNVFYGDGSPIDPAVLEGIRNRYDAQAVRFTWQPGDVLMVDNFLVAHGRDTYVGPREILVAMADLCTSSGPFV